MLTALPDTVAANPAGGPGRGEATPNAYTVTRLPGVPAETDRVGAPAITVVASVATPVP